MKVRMRLRGDLELAMQSRCRDSSRESMSCEKGRRYACLTIVRLSLSCYFLAAARWRNANWMSREQYGWCLDRLRPGGPWILHLRVVVVADEVVGWLVVPQICSSDMNVVCSSCHEVVAASSEELHRSCSSKYARVGLVERQLAWLTARMSAIISRACVYTHTPHTSPSYRCIFFHRFGPVSFR